MLIGRMLGHSFPGLGIDPAILQAGVVKPVGGGTIMPGMCTSDSAFIWRGATATAPAHWERRAAGEQCQGLSTVQGNVRTGQGGGVSVDGVNHGPITLVYDFDTSANAASSDPNAAKQSLQVGPFKIPLSAREYTIHWTGLMPADWAAFIVPELAHDCSNCVFTSMEDATAGHTMGVLRDFFGDATPPKINKDLVTVPSIGFLVDGVFRTSYSGGGSYPLAMKISLPDQPIAVVSRPDNGETWGMFMVVLPRDPTYPWDSTTNPYVLNFFWRKQPQGVWDWIKRIVGAIVDFVESAVCSLVPVALKAPPAGAVTAGIVAGSIVLKMSGVCNPDCPQGMTYNQAINGCACPMGMTYDATSKTCVPYVPPPASTTWMWWLGGAIGVLALLALATKSKNKSLPAPA